jgi:hypothetical protein
LITFHRINYIGSLGIIFKSIFDELNVESHIKYRYPHVALRLRTEVLFSNITLDEYSESAIGLLESQFPNFTLIESFETTLSGYPAHQIGYTYTLEGLNLKNMQIWTIADNNVAYALTYGGIIEEFDSSLPVIENMIESFQLTEIQQ